MLCRRRRVMHLIVGELICIHGIPEISESHAKFFSARLNHCRALIVYPAWEVSVIALARVDAIEDEDWLIDHKEQTNYRRMN